MKRTRSDKVKPVLSFTRRSDGVGNREQLDSFLAGLARGSITYAHPKVFSPFLFIVDPLRVHSSL